MAGPVVVEDVRDAEVVQAVVDVRGHREDAGLDGIDVGAAAERPAGLAVAGPQPERQPAQVLGEVVRVVGAPAHLLRRERAPERAGRGPVGGRDRVDHRRSDAGRRGRVDRSRQAQRGGEQIRVAGRVGEGAEAAHREAGDRALPPHVERSVVAVDPGDQLLDVPVLPARLAAGAVVEPVRVEAAEAAVGHHDDQRKLGRELLGLALAGAGPRGPVAARAVEQVQHRVAVLALRGVSGREQDADLRRLGKGGGAQRELVQAWRQALVTQQPRGARACRRGHEREQRREYEQAESHPIRVDCPPSTGSRTPVTKRASSEARKTAALATSQALPIPPLSGTVSSRTAA